MSSNIEISSNTSKPSSTLTPDCILEILQYLDDDSSLFRYILINRTWCNLGIPFTEKIEEDYVAETHTYCARMETSFDYDEEEDYDEAQDIDDLNDMKSLII
ncbi:9692_t:CDS:2 [Funneliformis geosporum]|uniref:115_t:CDS:1 n=1 Tax=Funneliformis geosporum TaxID=1117311 RepID=A0A9W4SH13_9GLOM|nr:9692_t:CDS:2 [Funneliformis geosporum]CAI2168773.1 115_t:CDS:2 [Funneliformis geosporum]